MTEYAKRKKFTDNNGWNKFSWGVHAVATPKKAVFSPWDRRLIDIIRDFGLLLISLSVEWMFVEREGNRKTWYSTV